LLRSFCVVQTCYISYTLPILRHNIHNPFGVHQDICAHIGPHLHNFCTRLRTNISTYFILSIFLYTLFSHIFALYLVKSGYCHISFIYFYTSCQFLSIFVYHMHAKCYPYYGTVTLCILFLAHSPNLRCERVFFRKRCVWGSLSKTDEILF